MLIVSNFLFVKSGITFPDHSVVRVNVAWIQTIDELFRTLKETHHDVYLDYPDGRTKPPKPQLTLDQTIELAHQFANVKYFAVSNVEDPQRVLEIKDKLPERIEIIPKIETPMGVKNLEQIAAKLSPSYIMFDKEDLYSNINHDSQLFLKLVALTRKKCKKLQIQVLELHGVVFLPYE